MDIEILQKGYTYYLEEGKRKNYTEFLDFNAFASWFSNWIHMNRFLPVVIPFLCNNGRSVILDSNNIINKIKNS